MQSIHLTEDGKLIAVSNEMQFRFDQHKIKWLQEWEILDKCKGIDLNWSLVDVNLYQQKMVETPQEAAILLIPRKAMAPPRKWGGRKEQDDNQKVSGMRRGV